MEISSSGIYRDFLVIFKFMLQNCNKICKKKITGIFSSLHVLGMGGGMTPVLSSPNARPSSSQSEG